ncbi:hypothetical protein MKX01_031390 [Papaver californicum]|nr:hypothetical protein MKX01_031390 [Papaver californicum]
MKDVGNMFVKMLNNRTKPNKVTFNTLIDGYCKTGDLDKAFEIRERMKCVGFVPDLRTFNTLLSGICRVNQINEVLELLDEMEKYGFVPDGFTNSSLIEVFSRLGKSDGLLAVSEAVLREGVQLNAYICCPLLKGLCKEGKVMEAEESLKRLMGKGFVPTRVINNTIVDGYCHGDVKKALSTIVQMESVKLKPDCLLSIVY